MFVSYAGFPILAVAQPWGLDVYTSLVGEADVRNGERVPFRYRNDLAFADVIGDVEQEEAAAPEHPPDFLPGGDVELAVRLAPLELAGVIGVQLVAEDVTVGVAP